MTGPQVAVLDRFHCIKLVDNPPWSHRRAFALGHPQSVLFSAATLVPPAEVKLQQHDTA